MVTTEIGLIDSRRMNLDFSLRGKVAIVTGGASGIGQAVVDAFAATGATAVVADLTVESFEPTTEHPSDSRVTSPIRTPSITS